MPSVAQSTIARCHGTAVAALAVLVGLTGCTLSGINLVQDRRVVIDAPAEQSSVSPPLTVRWSTEGIHGFRFVVFVDRPPIAPGASLRSLAKEDHACLARAGCPDPTWLAGKGIYVTDGTSIEVAALADNRPPDQSEARDAHDVTIVLLDGDRRSGESAWHRQFYVPRG